MSSVGEVQAIVEALLDVTLLGPIPEYVRFTGDYMDPWEKKVVDTLREEVKALKEENRRLKESVRSLEDVNRDLTKTVNQQL
jgi:hypothetical protein